MVKRWAVAALCGFYEPDPAIAMGELSISTSSHKKGDADRYRYDEALGLSGRI